jgi:hypothetical protein
MREHRCRVCGQQHDGLPLHYGVAAPALYFMIPESEREQRCKLTSDVCMVDEQHWFIVGNLEIPIIGAKERFSWDVWVSLSEQNMKRVRQLWETPGREAEPPYFGWLCTLLPGYPETLHLKTMVHTRAVGKRPFVELEATDHPLAVEQRDGITWDRVKEIAELVLHGPQERAEPNVEPERGAE